MKVTILSRLSIVSFVIALIAFSFALRGWYNVHKVIKLQKLQEIEDSCLGEFLGYFERDNSYNCVSTDKLSEKLKVIIYYKWDDGWKMDNINIFLKQEPVSYEIVNGIKLENPISFNNDIYKSYYFDE